MSLSSGEFVFASDLLDLPIDSVAVALRTVHVDRKTLPVRFDFEDLQHFSDRLPPARVTTHDRDTLSRRTSKCVRDVSDGDFGMYGVGERK